jgi:ArsR family transcriptional regulator
MEEKDTIAALTALAQTARLRVFRALVGAEPLGLTPGELAAMLDLPASTLSFHLKELVHAGLVAPSRAGRNLNYRPSLARMNALLDYLTAHCCQGAGCESVPACAAPARVRSPSLGD